MQAIGHQGASTFVASKMDMESLQYSPKPASTEGIAPAAGDVKRCMNCRDSTPAATAVQLMSQHACCAAVLADKAHRITCVMACRRTCEA